MTFSRRLKTDLDLENLPEKKTLKYFKIGSTEQTRDIEIYEIHEGFNARKMLDKNET